MTHPIINNALSESDRMRRLFRERFTFQISIDTAHAPQGLAVAQAALKAGVTILELGKQRFREPLAEDRHDVADALVFEERRYSPT